VCLCVCLCVREDSSGKHVVHVAFGRGSVLLRRRCDMLCTSGFAEDIMFFFYDGPYSGMNFVTKD